MADLIIPSSPISEANFDTVVGTGDYQQFSTMNNIRSALAAPGHIYNESGMCTADDPTPQQLQSLTGKQRNTIRTMIETYGEDVTMGIANLFADVDVQNATSNGIGLAGAVQGYADNRTGILLQKMDEIKELMEIHNRASKQLHSRGAIAAAKARETRIRMKVEELNKRFSSELNRLINKRRQLKRSPYTNPDRAVNMARDSRNASRFSVMNRGEFRRLVNMSRYVKVIGNRLIAVDLGFRAYSVYQQCRAGEDCMRAGIGEAAGAAAGIGAAYVGFTALGYAGAAVGAVISGPFLVLALAIGAAGVFIGSTIASNEAKSLAQRIYDYFMEDDDNDEITIDAYTYG